MIITPGLANARPLGLVRGARQRAHCWWKTVRRRAAHRSLQHQGLNLELFEMHIAYWSKFELEIIAVAFAQLSRSMGRQRMLQTSLMDLQFWESSSRSTFWTPWYRPSPWWPFISPLTWVPVINLYMTWSTSGLLRRRTFVEADLQIHLPGRRRAPRIQKDDGCPWQSSEEGPGRNAHECSRPG